MKKVKTTVSYVIDDGVKGKHRLGLNSLQWGDGILYTASRDSTIKSWKDGALQFSMEHHTDWVNDIVLCNQNNNLISASSDTTLKVWDTKDGNCLGSIFQHTDYVKALAYAPHAPTPTVASAGLDKSIYLWDLETLVLISDSKAEPNVTVAKAQKASIYSLAISDDGSTLVSGSPEKVIRVWDPRTGKKQKKIIGHTDNVKAVLLNNDGTMCLSGSSDGTVKLWDLGQQRCVDTFSFDDSVWALHANSNFSEFYAGCRDGSVFKINPKDSQVQLLFEESNPITKLLHCEDETIWAATTSPSINKWDLKGLSKTPAEDSKPSSPSSDIAEPFLTKPLCSSPSGTIQGAAGIVKYHILNNKRHVLTLDSEGECHLYDIVEAKRLRTFGNRSLEDVAKGLTEVVWVPNWFSIDTRIGSLMVHLTDAQAFNVEVYQNELGWETDPDDEDAKVNLGQTVLNCLFHQWKKSQEQSVEMETEMEDSTINESREESTDTASKEKEGSEEGKDALLKESQNLGPDPDNMKLVTKDSELSSAGGSLMNKIKVLGKAGGTKGDPSDLSGKAEGDEIGEVSGPPPFEISGNTAIIFGEETSSTGTSVSFFRCLVSEVGREAHRLNQLCPKWVYDCVIRGVFLPKDMSKLNFVLVSENEKKIPALPQNGRRLSAFRVLRVKKIIGFLVGKLKLDEPNPEETIEILCNNQVLPLSMNLGTIKMCIWKSGAELQLFYRFSAKKAK